MLRLERFQLIRAAQFELIQAARRLRDRLKLTLLLCGRCGHRREARRRLVHVHLMLTRRRWRVLVWRAAAVTAAETAAQVRVLQAEQAAAQ